MKNENAMTPATEMTTAEENTRLQSLMRTFEADYANGNDITESVTELATALALSVIRKCIDPQRKSAIDRTAVSNNGHNPALTAVRREIMADNALLTNTRTTHDNAYGWKFTEDGEVKTYVVDKAEEKSATKLQSESLGDGIDLTHTAIVALLEMAMEHAHHGGEWMERKYVSRRISRKVLIREDDTAKWVEEETSPIREVYRTLRREVQKSRAMQADPRNGYTYIEDVTADPDSTQIETVYRRLGKYADIGGYAYDINGKPKYDGVYTAGAVFVADYNDIVRALKLTDRQAKILSLRMRGYGYKAIATYFGINEAGVKIQLRRLREKCEKIGFTPEMWMEMTGKDVEI